MRRGWALTLAVVAALVGVGAGCKRGQQDAAPGSDQRPPPIAATERQMGTDACADYVARLCACAAKKPELAATCKLKHAKPEALALALAVADDPASLPDSVARAKVEVGKIVARCIEEAAQLPTLGCP